MHCTCLKRLATVYTPIKFNSQSVHSCKLNCFLTHLKLWWFDVLYRIRTTQI